MLIEHERQSENVLGSFLCDSDVGGLEPLHLVLWDDDSEVGLLDFLVEDQVCAGLVLTVVIAVAASVHLIEWPGSDLLVVELHPQVILSLLPCLRILVISRLGAVGVDI